MSSFLVQQSVISARFLTTFGHFIALLILFQTIDNNISLGLKDSPSTAERLKAVNTAWVGIMRNGLDII